MHDQICMAHEEWDNTVVCNLRPYSPLLVSVEVCVRPFLAHVVNFEQSFFLSEIIRSPPAYSRKKKKNGITSIVLGKLSRSTT